MLDVDDFDAVYQFDTSYGYNDYARRGVQQCRKELKILFFDRLLNVLQVKASSSENKLLYPPQSNAALRQLHANIVSASIPLHHKQSLLYYLLCDVGTVTKTEHDRQAITPAMDFANATHLPPKYLAVTNGLWHMDKLDFPPALEYLTQPSLLPTFAEEVLEVLLARDEWLLAFAYWQSVQLDVSPNNTSLRERVFAMLLRAGVPDALTYLREQPTQDGRKALFEKLIAFCLDNGRALELADLPFNDDEAGWFEAFLLHGKGKGLPHAADTVMVRRVALGQVKAALTLQKEHKMAKHKKGELGWEDVAGGLRKGLASNGARMD